MSYKPLKTEGNCTSANPKLDFFWEREGPQIPGQTSAYDRGDRERHPIFRVPHFQAPGSVTGLTAGTTRWYHIAYRSVEAGRHVFVAVGSLGGRASITESSSTLVTVSE